MKKLITIISLIGINTYAVAQVTIGKTAPTNNSVLLEFGSERKGVILPSVSNLTNPVEGSFVFDSNTKQVQVWEGKNNNNNGGWTSLSSKLYTGIADGANNPFVNAGNSVQSQGVIIGAETSTKPGVLVLESTTKAMVLPQVSNPHQLTGVVAGTMVYDTNSDMIAVFDGSNWSYWK